MSIAEMHLGYETRLVEHIIVMLEDIKGAQG